MTRILAALDADAPSREAEQLALLLSRATGAELVLCTVYPYIAAHARVDTRHYERLLRREAEAFLQRRSDVLRDEIAAIGTRAVGSYSAAHGLHRLAEEVEADLVVLGPTRRKRAGRVFPGTMAARLAHGAPCPVAVAPEEYSAGALTRIGVAFTAADDGREALHVAASLALATGSALRILSVAAPLPWMDLVEPSFDGETLQEQYRRHVAYQLEAAVATLPDGLAIESDTLTGDPVEQIAAEVDDLDLLVCGSRGHGPLGAVALGSISQALLAAISCPLLIASRHS